MTDQQVMRPINPITVVLGAFGLFAVGFGAWHAEDPGVLMTGIIGGLFGFLGATGAFWEAGNWHYVIRDGKPFMVRSWPRLELDAREAESILYYAKCYFQVRGHPKRRVKLVMIYGLSKAKRRRLEEAFHEISRGPDGVHLVGLDRRLLPGDE